MTEKMQKPDYQEYLRDLADLKQKTHDRIARYNNESAAYKAATQSSLSDVEQRQIALLRSHLDHAKPNQVNGCKKRLNGYLDWLHTHGKLPFSSIGYASFQRELESLAAREAFLTYETNYWETSTLPGSEERDVPHYKAWVAELAIIPAKRAEILRKMGPMAPSQDRPGQEATLDDMDTAP